jgi:hypothetical protein
MGRAEELSRVLLGSSEGSGWKSPFTRAGARVVDATLPPSVRHWQELPPSFDTYKRARQYLREHESRTDKVGSGLARRVVLLEAEVAQLKERLQQSEAAPLVRLIEAGRVTEARQLVSLLLKASPSPRLEQWARVLAPPEVSVAPAATGSSMARDNAWLRANARDYAGQWVALRDGVLVDADRSRMALHRRLEQAGALDGVAFAHL